MEQIESVEEQVNALENTLIEAQKSYEDDYRPQVEDYEKKRELGYNILFVIPLAALPFTVLSMIIRKPCCYTLLSFFFLLSKYNAISFLFFSFCFVVCSFCCLQTYYDICNNCLCIFYCLFFF